MTRATEEDTHGTVQTACSWTVPNEGTTVRGGREERRDASQCGRTGQHGDGHAPGRPVSRGLRPGSGSDQLRDRVAGDDRLRQPVHAGARALSGQLGGPSPSDHCDCRGSVTTHLGVHHPDSRLVHGSRRVIPAAVDARRRVDRCASRSGMELLDPRSDSGIDHGARVLEEDGAGDLPRHRSPSAAATFWIGGWRASPPMRFTDTRSSSRSA